MAIEMAEARGTVTIRPWRVGLLIDTRSQTEVRDAILALSSVWGGRSMPIFDKNLAAAELESLGEMFDVDSLYADSAEGQVEELLNKPGWGWRGRAEWGPFANHEDKTFHTGLLPIRELIPPEKNLVLPEWSADDPADLVFAAMWGLPDRLGVPYDTLNHKDLLSRRGVSETGVLNTTMLHINTERQYGKDNFDGIYVLHSDSPEHIVRFWNMRVLGNHVIGLPSEASLDLLDLLLEPQRSYPSARSQNGGDDQAPLYFFGADRSSSAIVERIEGAARTANRLIVHASEEPRSPLYFAGHETEFKRSVRVEFRPDTHGIDVDLPRLSLASKLGQAFRRGIVAVEVQLRDIRGQDPRFTAHIPPYRRHAALLEHRHSHQVADHVRSVQGGVAFGIDATFEDVHVPFVYAQDAIGLLFDSDNLKVAQSDVGRFQTRAAEKFGGPYSGMINQSGVRAAIALAAGKPSGISLPHLRNAVENSRGGWPHALMDGKTLPREYAIKTVNNLFHTGLFVPTLKVHCSHCRVESYVSADTLRASMNCEFCSQDYNLALSHSLSQPEWRYRLAAHLRPDQVEALLPALATTSLLQQLQVTSELPPLVLGLELSLDGRKMEADIATYLGDYEWLAVLGEVKTGNRIDSRDVQNLEFLRGKLNAKNVRCLLLFATLKDALSSEERRDLRELVERSMVVKTSRGQRVLNLPLILTGPDLSRNYWDVDHPWRWEKKDQAGIFDTARVSCERNLGLVGYTRNPDTGRHDFIWAD